MKKPSRLYMAALCGLLALAAGAARADEEVIVRGTRLATYRGDAVFSHVDIGASDISRVAAVDQALKAVSQASLFRRASSLTANPTIQGLSLRAIGPSGAGRALVTLDGVPQNDPFGGWVIWAGMPTQAIGRAHVLRGAGGGAYGAGALTGVVDLSPSAASGVNVDVAAGSRSSSRIGVGAAAGEAQAGSAFYYSTATLRGDVPVREGRAGGADVATFGRDRAVLGHTEWHVGDGLVQLMAGAYDSRRDTGLAGATARATGDQASFSYTQQPSSQPGFNAQIWLKNSNLTNRSVSVATGRSATTLANDQVKTPSAGQGFKAALRGQTPEREWEIGIDGRSSSGEAREFYRYVSAAPTRFRVAGGSSRTTGFYGLASQSTGAVLWTGALRVDRWQTFGGHRSERDTTSGALLLNLHPEDHAGTIASGRVGFGVRTGNVVWRAAAYTGFRPPSLNELYRPFRVGNDVTEANDALRPERLAGGEAGVKLSSGKWQFDVDVFVSDLRDPIVNVTLGQGPGLFGNAGFIPAGGAYRQRQNRGRIRATGAELQGEYEHNQQLTLSLSATLTNARSEGLRPAQAPEYSGNVGVEWRPGKATVSADWAFEGKSFDDDLNQLTLKAYSRIGLDVTYPVSSHLDLTVSIDNALDSKIAQSHAGDGVIGYDTRRSVWLGLRFKG